MHNATLLSDCSIDYVLSCKMPQIQIDSSFKKNLLNEIGISLTLSWNPPDGSDFVKLY